MRLDFRPRSATRRIVLHDSHTSPILTEVAHWLLTNGRARGLLTVGYHFVIERDGRVVKCRPEDCIGSHTPTHNHDSIGVCLAGGEHGRDDFTFDQMQAVFQLCVYLTAKYPGAAIVGHSEIQRFRNHSHDCPAFDIDVHVRDRIEQFRWSHLLDTPMTEPQQQQQHAIPPATMYSQQHKILLDILRQGRSLTTQIALINLGIGSLSSRIAELRAQGHNIVGEWDKDYHGNRYMKYRLEGEKTE